MNHSEIKGDDLSLSEKQRHIVKISAYTSSGKSEELKKTLNDALNAGLTINEIKEIIVQLYAFCGFPRSLNGIDSLRKVIRERKNKGIHDIEGESGKFLPKNIDKDKYGREIRVKLIKVQRKSPFAKFAPALDKFLDRHLFADILGRGVLSLKDREIATIAALASRKRVDAQIKNHIKIGHNLGLTSKQTDEILKLTAETENDFFKSEKRNSDSHILHRGKSIIKYISLKPRRSNEDIHHAKERVLIVIDGRGYYREEEKFLKLEKGNVINIPPETKYSLQASDSDSLICIITEIPDKSKK